jgi:polyphosphate kinase
MSEAAPLLEAEDRDVSPEEFLNRELSWLEFNRRVLHEALDARTPLLERVRFLCIFSSNLDEFFMKRVAVLRRQAASGRLKPTPDGLTPEQQLSAIRAVVAELLRQQGECYTSAILPGLAGQGIHLLRWEQLTDAERAEADVHFRQNVFPILTPLAVDPGHPFPFISNLSESLGLVLHHPRDGHEPLFARVKIPASLMRWIPLSRAAADTPPAAAATTRHLRFFSLYDLIRQNLDQLFPGMVVEDSMLFRVTRSAEADTGEAFGDEDDVREVVEEELRQRRFAQVVRLEHAPSPNPWLLRLLVDELELTDADVYEVPAELEYEDLRPIGDLAIPGLRHEPWTPTVPAALADVDTDIFAVIRSGNLLVHHPYESFNASVERFGNMAANDSRVQAIKMTLYRTSDDSPFIRTLVHAAEAGKQVACLVELKARFDEQRNIVLAQKLEDAGVHVVYGVVGLKTHTKVTLVVRQDPDRIRCYAHIGTGNYHGGTAQTYTDLGLFTCDERITTELVELFHYLTGRSLKRDYAKLLVAPVNMRARFLEMIENEIQHKRAGRPARIIAKMNSLEDRRIIRALYRASQAGVPVDLIVRGFCCLRPGVSGLSDNIRVISIIGRFLEHSRIYYFRNGADDEADGLCYISSADWMYRNLLARVEVAVPIDDRPLRQRCLGILLTSLQDRRLAWEMQSDGHYVQRTPASPAEEKGTHALLMEAARPHRTA